MHQCNGTWYNWMFLSCKSIVSCLALNIRRTLNWISCASLEPQVECIVIGFPIRIASKSKEWGVSNYSRQYFQHPDDLNKDLIFNFLIITKVQLVGTPQFYLWKKYLIICKYLNHNQKCEEKLLKNMIFMLLPQLHMLILQPS